MIIVIRKQAIMFSSNNITPRRLRRVVKDCGHYIATCALSEFDASDESKQGTWRTRNIEGYIEEKDIEPFLVWEALNE